MAETQGVPVTVLAAHHGQVTTRTPEGIRKQAVRGDGEDRYAARCAGIAREAMMLETLEGRGIAPRLIDVGPDWSLQEDLGDSAIPDGERFRRACTRLLYEIRQAGLRHGDLTEANIVLRDDRAWAVDWQDASWTADERPLQRSGQPDGHFLWRFVAGTAGYREIMPDVPRVVRRWQAVRTHMPPNAYSLVDLGCFQGDFVAMAAAEGMASLGIDQGGFRTGENSIAIARELWAPLMANRVNLVEFQQGDIREWVAHAPSHKADIILLFSTWPYLLQDAGWGTPGPLTRAQGWEFIRQTAERCRVLFFETQYAGDGPGPPWLRDDADMARELQALGLNHEPVGTFPVTGRPASRTVWKVTT